MRVEHEPDASQTTASSAILISPMIGVKSCFLHRNAAHVVITGRGGAGVSVDGDDRPGPHAAQGADDEQGRALHLDRDRARRGVGLRAKIEHAPQGAGSRGHVFPLAWPPMLLFGKSGRSH